MYGYNIFSTMQIFVHVYNIDIYVFMFVIALIVRAIGRYEVVHDFIQPHITKTVYMYVFIYFYVQACI